MPLSNFFLKFKGYIDGVVVKSPLWRGLKLFPKPYVIKTWPGFWLLTDNKLHARWYATSFEREVGEAFLKLKGRFDVAVDLGCREGFWSFMLARKVEKVIAFDRSLTALKYLMLGARLNKISNVTPVFYNVQLHDIFHVMSADIVKLDMEDDRFLAVLLDALLNGLRPHVLIVETHSGLGISIIGCLKQFYKCAAVHKRVDVYPEGNPFNNVFLLVRK